jgi:tRNA modification GTPase
VAEALGAMAGVRPAEAGEFSRRAFLNGKMDLTEAEGLADLVAAETRAQRRQALRQLDGGLSRLYDDWRQALIEISAEVEAAIDFSDEADVPAALEARARTRIGGLLDSLRGHLDDGHRGERLRDGFYVAILGPPNVGKSSLLNALARRDAAIVAATAGTTRDVVEVQLDLGGYPAIVADTAGLRETADAVEDQGVRRALARAAVADLKLVVVEAGAAPAQLAEMADLIDGDSLTVVNKCDMESPAANFDGGAVYRISVKTGDGVAALLSALGRAVAARLESAGAPSLTRARHRTAATEAVAALERAAAAEAVELLAEDLRSAARALGRITGRVDVEDILDVVFASFCIGK